MMRKQFKYFAIRVANTVIFRRTINTLQKVKSVLYNPRTEFKLEQITYTGGRVIGCMPYLEWSRHGGSRLSTSCFTQLTKEQYRALDPYICKEGR